MGLPGSSLRVLGVEVRMFSMCSLTSSLSNIYLHTSMMTCLGFVFISWAILFSIISRDKETLSRLLLGEVNVESTSSVGRG